MSAPRRICLLGSSCNPPTGDGGHRLLAKHFAALYDEVWVLPVYKHIFANKSNLAPFEERVAMARINFESVAPNVQVKRLEEEVVTAAVEAALKEGQDPAKVSVGSYDLLMAIRERHPGVRWGWVMGADTYNDLRAGKWKNSALIPTLVDIELVVRPGVDLQHDLVQGATLHAIPGQDDTSSTRVRDCRDLTELSTLLYPPVAEYIQRHKLYGFADPDPQTSSCPASP